MAGVFHKRLTPHEGVDRIDQVGEVVDSCRERCHHCCASGGRKRRGLRSPGGRVVLGNAIAKEEAKAVAKGSGFPLVSLIGDGFRTHGRCHVDTSVFHERRAPRDSRRKRIGLLQVGKGVNIQPTRAQYGRASSGMRVVPAGERSDHERSGTKLEIQLSCSVIVGRGQGSGREDRFGRGASSSGTRCSRAIWRGGPRSGASPNRVRKRGSWAV